MSAFIRLSISSSRVLDRIVGSLRTFGVDFRLHASYASILDSSVTTVDVE